MLASWIVSLLYVLQPEYDYNSVHCILMKDVETDAFVNTVISFCCLILCTQNSLDTPRLVIFKDNNLLCVMKLILILS